MKRERLFDLKACAHCGAETLAPFMFPTRADDGSVAEWVVACGDIWTCGAAVSADVAEDAAARWNRRQFSNGIWERTLDAEMSPDLAARMLADADEEADGEGPFEDLGDGMSVRAVSDKYAAEVMGMTPEALREMLAGIEAGDVRTYTLDEVLEQMKKNDPEFETLLEAERAKLGRRRH